MFRSPTLRIAIGVVAAIAVLGLLRFKPWRQPDTPATQTRQELAVGYLPVT